MNTNVGYWAQRDDDTKKKKTSSFKYYVLVKKKGKAVPLQAWTGPDGSRKFRFPDFVTTAQDDGRL